MALLLVVVAIFALLSAIAGEYLIKDRQVPSYLYHKFTNVEEDVFPRDIRINMSLSRVSGTLLYSIDNSMNQLIVTLYHSMEATLVVEFNKQQFGFSFPKLCGCEMCQYEAFDLRIMLGDNLDLQCNGGTVVRKVFARDRGLNEGYILPYERSPGSGPSIREAKLWLVNNPSYGQIFPNNDQLAGCIFGVSYRGREVTFTEVSANVGRECSPACRGDTCNGGRCHETYSEAPLCDCTAAFSNGVYCNDTIPSVNARSASPHLIFDAFKLSWRSSSRDLMVLENTRTKIALSRAGEVLTLEHRIMVGRGSTTRYVLSEGYVPNRRYILVGAFSENTVNTAIYDNGAWHHGTLWTGIDLRREMFTSLSLRSGGGIIGMAYKTSTTDLYWRNVSIATYGLLEDEKATRVPTDAPNAPCNTILILYGAIGLYIILFVVVAVKVYIHVRNLVRRRRIKKKWEASSNDALVADTRRYMEEDRELQMSTYASKPAMEPSNRETASAGDQRRHATLMMLDVRTMADDRERRSTIDTGTFSTLCTDGSVSSPPIRGPPCANMHQGTYESPRGSLSSGICIIPRQS